MSESPASIAAWAEETFGPAAKPADLARRAALELDELIEAVEAGDHAEAGRELADILILLYRLAHDLGMDPDAEVAAKMAVNRARTWVAAGDGTGRHVDP